MKPLKKLNYGVTDGEEIKETSQSDSIDATSLPISTTSIQSTIDNERSITADIYDDAEQVSAHPTNVTPTAATSPDTIRLRQRMTQNFLLIWIDLGIDESKQDCQNSLVQLRNVVNDVNIFTQKDEAIDFLTDLHDVKAFLIIEGTIGQLMLPFIHDISQLYTIYVLSDTESLHEQWAQEWVKIRGVHTEIKPICEALQLDVQQCNQDSVVVSFLTMDEKVSSQNLNQLEPNFMYTQIFKEILLEMEYDEKSIKDLAAYCRGRYDDNIRQLNIINEFEYNYRSKSPIWWYTRECFTYQMLNRALRTLEGDTIINMGFFIRDLHEQIEQLHWEQIDTYHGKSFTIYRGQGLLKTDFEKLLKSKGGLISFNNFLSTSKNQDISLRFAKNASTKIDMVGILFIMIIDPLVSSVPFASIREVSYYRKEEEVLFSMHTVFRISEIIKINNDDSLYQVNLRLTADDDQELRTLTKCIQEEVVGETGWKRLGVLLLQINQFNKAEELHKVLLEQTSDESEKALYYNQLGYIKHSEGDYQTAIEYYEKRLEIQRKNFPPNHPTLTVSYNNIGVVYKDMGEYPKALLYFEKALEINQNSLSPNYLDLAQSYHNIGGIYFNMAEYSKAVSFYEKALEIRQKSLPSNHPALATSYNNISFLYDSMGEYSKALSVSKQALDIRLKSLPPDHPDLAQSYNNVGLAYSNMEEYSKALSFYEKSLEICQKTLPENHSSLATSYHNIAGVYNDMGEHLKALSFYEKALEIQHKALPSNHPNIALTYNKIGSVYINMAEYSKALSFHEKALEIRLKILPTHHPDLATSYNDISMVYYNIGEYSKALSYLERALNILQNSLPPNHPEIQNVQQGIKIVRKKL